MFLAPCDSPLKTVNYSSKRWFLRSALSDQLCWLFESSLEVDSMLWQLRRGRYGHRTSRAQFQGLPGTVGHVAGPRVWVCSRSVGPSSRQVPCHLTICTQAKGL